MLNARLVLTFLSVAVLLVPLLLPEYLSPALLPGFDALHRTMVHNVWISVVVLGAIAAGAWSQGPTGQTAALYVLVLLWIARTPPVDLFSASSPLAAFASELPVRAALAAAVLLGTAGALMRWQSTRAGFVMIGAATVAYTAASVYVADNNVAVATENTSSSSSSGCEQDSASMAADVTAPLSSLSSSSSGADDPVMLVPVKVSVTALPAETTTTRQAPYAVTLEEHMVQLRAPPNQATVNWNAPAYGSALGMGTRAACGSFKSDNSEVTRKMKEASGHFV